jgi:hypothetical protein
VTALTRPGALPIVCPECELEAADINGDGQISVTDIGPFVELLTMPPDEE